MQIRALVVVLALSLALPSSGLARAQSLPGTSDDGPQVLVLGTWHMASIEGGPDDILDPDRQAQLQEVIAALAAFRPTKIALETAFYRDDEIARLYDEVLSGERELSRNERQQLGFRLARQLGHETVYAIDADGDFPLARLQDYVKANGRQEEFDARQRALRAWLGEWNSYLRDHTLLEALLYMNSDAYVATMMEKDYELAHFGEPWNWAGPDLMSDWFRRNIRIYGNIVSLATSSEDRVLVIIGAGHLPWLRHNFAADPGVRLRKLDEFAR